MNEWPPHQDLTSADAEAFHGRLWDTKDPTFLDKVVCEAFVKLTAINDKSSQFELRIKCKWKFRTRLSAERTETHLRFPGLRLPGLVVVVEENRIWRDLEETRCSTHSVMWRGVSRFLIRGFERFEMHDFPYDRQLVTLDVFDFVWQREKTGGYDFSMHLVSLQVHCISVLPQRKACNVIIAADNARSTKARSSSISAAPKAPEFASRFSVKLCIERCAWFHVLHCFGFTILVTISSLLPLCMPSEVSKLGSRTSLHAAGLLTLTSVKLGVSDTLPCVPYTTRFDRMMLAQFACVMACAIEACVASRMIEDGLATFETVDELEVGAFFLFLAAWSAYWLHLVADHLGLPCGARAREWDLVLQSQEYQGDGDELEMLAEHRGSAETDAKKLSEIMKALGKIDEEILEATVHAEATVHSEKAHRSGGAVQDLSRHLAKLQATRNTLESQLSRYLPSPGEEPRRDVFLL